MEFKSPLKTSSLFFLFLIVIFFLLFLGLGSYMLIRKNLIFTSLTKPNPSITQVSNPTQTSAQPMLENWKFYKNEKLYFSVNYPQEWFLSEQSPGSGIQQNFLGGIMISNVPTDKFTYSGDNKTVWINLAKVDKDLSLEKWVQEIIPDKNSIVSTENITINDSSALKLIQKIYIKEGSNYFNYVFLKKETLGWLINTFSASSNNQSAELDQIISSFKFLPVSSYVEQIEMMGASMEPALKNGYRYTIDRDAYITAYLNRGDIVLIEKPDKLQIQIIKRIIGLPSETIMIKEGKVFINGSVLNEPYLSEPDSTVTYDPGFLKEGEKISIGQNQYFVMGDYRNHSSDSREWGLIANQDIKGKINPL